MIYTKEKLSTGQEIEIRPLTWSEFWNLTEQRTKELSDFAKGPEKDDSYALILLTKKHREAPLEICVSNWNNLKEELTLSEVLEIEAMIKKNSKVNVEEGN